MVALLYLGPYFMCVMQQAPTGRYIKPQRVTLTAKMQLTLGLNSNHFCAYE